MDEVTQTPRIPSHKERVANRHIYTSGSRDVPESKLCTKVAGSLTRGGFVPLHCVLGPTFRESVWESPISLLTCGSRPNFKALYSSPFSPLTAKAKAIKKPKRKGGAYNIGTQSTNSWTSPSFSERRKPFFFFNIGFKSPHDEGGIINGRK